MTRFAFILLTGLFLVTCSSHDELDIPSHLLSEEKMIDVLTSCYLAEGASGINIKNVETRKFDSTYAFNPLKDAGIRQETFDSSIAFYSKHPKTLKNIYEKVLDKLSEIQAKGKVD